MRTLPNRAQADSNVPPPLAEPPWFPVNSASREPEPLRPEVERGSSQEQVHGGLQLGAVQATIWILELSKEWPEPSVRTAGRSAIGGEEVAVHLAERLSDMDRGQGLQRKVLT